MWDLKKFNSTTPIPDHCSEFLNSLWLFFIATAKKSANLKRKNIKLKTGKIVKNRYIMRNIHLSDNFFRVYIRILKIYNKTEP